jgi:hypothetical protein
MSIIKKTLFDEKLETINVLINDEDATSKYFKLTELPDTFTGGKNAFLIQGSPDLVSDTLIKIQIKDAAGNIIYHEPGEGMITTNISGSTNAPIITEYYEGVSKVVSVYVYPETAYGPCTLTILGELSEYDNNGLREPVPLDWQGQYNVKWQKQINVNPSLANTTKIRFYKRPVAAITEILSPIYRIESGSKVDSGTNQSFANIKLSNLETFAGDVKRIKVFRTSLGDISDYDMIQDILVESKELLTSYDLSGSVVGITGILTSETLENYWNTGSLNAYLTSSRVESGVALNGSGNFTYTSSLDIKSTNTYELNLDAFYSSSTNSNLGIYLASGSMSSSIGTLYGISPTKNLLDTVIPFKISTDYPSASLYFSQSQGEWHLGNISLKLSEDTAFSPDEISFVTTMPTVIGNETYNFKFEFYDVNNNYVPVAVTQSANFTGGTNTSNTALLISASFVSASNLINAVSASISGTMTVYSSSADNTIVTLSGSVSGSIKTVSGSVFTLSGSVSSSLTNLSASFSQSNATILSSSLQKVQQLANGQFSGSFIGDTVIYSPAIGGQVGYIKELFTVGDTSAAQINLDARTSTRKIYIGTGTYNNSNTSIYLDSSGQFSLKDKLTFDTSGNLSVNGTINVTGGNAATQTFASTIGTNAVTSGSISAAAAQTAAELFASSEAGRAVTSGSVAATAAQQAAITQAKTDASASINLLANGNWTAGNTFISANAISSPIIAGNGGYISGLFVVGNGGAITLDGTNKKIYIGAGTYSNSNTAFYVDNTGKFSLKDKLTWDGTTLGITGNITITGGNAATTTDVSTAQSTAISTAASDATSKANAAQSTAISTAASDATSKANAAQSAAISQASTYVTDLANGAWTAGNGTFITSTSISSPTIAGNAGFISGLFKVGSSGITLDGTNKKIYIGAGNYSNADTGFYVDNNSNFSLKDKLTWNGATLSIDGVINATSGSIAGWQLAPSGLSKTSGVYLLKLDSTNQKISISKTAETVPEIYDVVVLSALEDLESITPNQSVGALDWNTLNTVVQTYNYQDVSASYDTGFEVPDGHNQTRIGGYGVIGLVYANEEIYVDPDILFTEAPVNNVIQVSTVGQYYANWKLVLRVRRFPTIADADAGTNADATFGDRQVIAAERILARDAFFSIIDEKQAYGAVVQATGGGGIETEGTPVIYKVELKQIWTVQIIGGDSNDSVTFQRPGGNDVRVQYTRVSNGYSILSPGGLRVYQGLKNYASFKSPSGTTGDDSNFMLIKGKSQIDGSLNVSSGFSAANKQFKIQHPVDANKWLYHTSIESPRADLIYRGVIQLMNGVGTISIDSASNMMDGTYVALTKNQQLFLQNESGFDRVIGTVIDGVVSITSENSISTDTINWMVIAERNDVEILQSPLYNSDGKYKPERYKRDYINQLYNSI